MLSRVVPLTNVVITVWIIDSGVCEVCVHTIRCKHIDFKNLVQSVYVCV